MSEECKGIAFIADDGGPELVSLPEGSQVFPLNPPIDIKDYCITVNIHEIRIRQIVVEELAKMKGQLLEELVQQVRQNAGRRI